MEVEIGPKKCLYCPKIFKYGDIRNRHIREKHPDKVFAANSQNIIMT